MKLEDEIKTNLNSYKTKNKKQHGNLTKWINRLIKYALEDNRQNNKRRRYRSFPRGSIVKVDFGFNVGYEIGGVHYAVVLNNNDSPYSGIVNVVPLVSKKKKKKKINISEVDIDIEFFEYVENSLQVNGRDAFRTNLYIPYIEKELAAFNEKHPNGSCKIDDEFKDTYVYTSQMLLWDYDLDNTFDEKEITLKELTSLLEKEKKSYNNSANTHRKTLEEIQFMNTGSIVKVDQFKAISKRRIINPKNKYYAMNNIKLSNNTMDIINDKLKELFVFDKG